MTDSCLSLCSAYVLIARNFDFPKLMPLKKSIKKHVCRSDNCSYLISCKVCWKQYVGEKSDLRKSNHNLTIKIKKKKKISTPGSNISFQPKCRHLYITNKTSDLCLYLTGKIWQYMCVFGFFFLLKEILSLARSKKGVLGLDCRYRK